MIPCTCINDKNRPETIPTSKWIKRDTKYHVTFTLTVLPQRVLAFSLYEKPLDDSCTPYLYFAADRFSFTPEALELLRAFIKDIEDASDIDINELLENSNLINQ